MVNDAASWDKRYSESDLVWSIEPNVWVREIVEPLEPGTAIDVAAGEGRNALWMAGRRWRVTALDYSQVAVDRMARLAQERLDDEARARITARVADATAPLDGIAPAELVVVCYLQLPEPQMRQAVDNALALTRPGGMVVIVGHSLRNLTEGTGGPSQPEVLYDPGTVVDWVGADVLVERAELVERRVEGRDTPALDTVVVLRRPTA